MSYLVLARKYRPLVFENVFGQEHVTRTLENAIKTGRLANAYLFSGPRGVGKTTVARILAKAINCEHGPTTTPCNQCDNCKEITESRSLDVFEIDGASNRGIDEVRNLRENLRYAPNKGKYKIYIIDEVHMLTVEAFNALLKTLEEPPKSVLFIFATTEPHKVPATIASRCQRFSFKRIPIKKIIQQLEIIAKNENIQIDAESLQVIAKKADGGMRDAESLLDQAYSYAGNVIKYESLIELLGIIDNEIFFKLTEYIRSRDVKGILRLVDTVFMEGYDAGEFLIHAVEHFRNLLVARVTKSSNQLDVTETLSQRYLKEAELFTEEDLLRYIKIATDTEYAIKRSAQPRLKFEFALLKMVKMETTLNLGQLLEKITGLQANLKTSPVPPLKNHTLLNDRGGENYSSDSTRLTIEQRKNQILNSLTESKMTADSTSEDSSETGSSHTKPSITLELVKQHWPEVIEHIKHKKVALGVFVNEGVPTAVHENVIDITFGKDNGFHINTINKNKLFIENIIKTVIGVPVRIRCLKGTLPAQPTEKVAVEETNTNTVNEVKETEIKPSILDEIISVFDGEYVS